MAGMKAATSAATAETGATEPGTAETGATEPGTAEPARARRPRRAKRAYGGALVLFLAALYFVVPILASLWFTVDDPAKGFTLDAYAKGLTDEGMLSALGLSLRLGLATVALGLLLMVPTMVVVALRLPRLRRVVEVLCMVPLIVPPIALVAGVSTVLSWEQDLAATPFYRTFQLLQNKNFPLVLVLVYTVMSLPFLYRALDAGLRGIDLKTLVEASRSLGASRTGTLWRVVVPNLRSAVVSGAVLSLAMVLGEFTVATVLGFEPFSVWMVHVGEYEAQLSVAAAMLSLLITWGLLLLLTNLAGGRARNRRKTTA
ncbi:ABC transporter permease [Streptomyces iconiensis]|uniref:ABC transporter permease subunit n=1 Tax=Streptomyces iconiensis TaxID=1384038 RepID=A0ABT7A495_9ACTN|nr:ABC transporter permease subunit [Streptomyces iconiensis]MDJ1136111.1 ABC transporter permease subunit [Streptomyces iconiensis]